MTEVKSYECREALVAIAMEIVANTPVDQIDVKSHLISLTDIPVEALDRATTDTKDMLPDLMMLIALQAALGVPMTMETFKEMFQTALWKDDNKRETTLGMTARDEASGTEATVSLTRKNGERK